MQELKPTDISTVLLLQYLTEPQYSANGAVRCVVSFYLPLLGGGLGHAPVWKLIRPLTPNPICILNS